MTENSRTRELKERLENLRIQAGYYDVNIYTAINVYGIGTQEEYEEFRKEQAEITSEISRIEEHLGK